MISHRIEVEIGNALNDFLFDRQETEIEAKKVEKGIELCVIHCNRFYRMKM